MTLCTKQFKRTALMGMFLQKALEESRLACSTSPLTDSTFQGSHASVHAHWSSLTHLTFPGPHGRLTAPWKGHTMLCRRCHRCLAHLAHLAPPSHTHTLPSWEQARWMPKTAERQPLNLRGSQLQNKGMTSEFGSDIRLVVSIALLRLTLSFLYKWIIASSQLHFSCARKLFFTLTF